MTNYEKLKDELMQDPEFRAEYERTRPEYEIMHAIIDARIKSNMTQKESSAKSGVRQSNISRIEKRDLQPYHCNSSVIGGRAREKAGHHL